MQSGDGHDTKVGGVHQFKKNYIFIPNELFNSWEGSKGG